MQKINDLFGKRVINQGTGDQMASVRDIVLDGSANRIVALIIGNGRSSDEQAVRWEQISGVGEFIIVDGSRSFAASNDDAEIVELRRSAERITGKKIISASGEQLGTVGDMYFNRSGAILGFALKNSLFSGSDQLAIRAADIQAVGKDAVISTTSDPIPLNALDEDAAEAPYTHDDERASRLGIRPVDLDDSQPDGHAERAV